ncbi:hypothetical protein F66182_8266 [Fusarium sp. NRRL 66182]|nr:hypothetical protein F66182_8266 [Fusarium sp. NRRL 66182]
MSQSNGFCSWTSLGDLPQSYLEDVDATVNAWRRVCIKEHTLGFDSPQEDFDWGLYTARSVPKLHHPRPRRHLPELRPILDGDHSAWRPAGGEPGHRQGERATALDNLEGGGDGRLGWGQPQGGKDNSVSKRWRPWEDDNSARKRRRPLEDDDSVERRRRSWEVDKSTDKHMRPWELESRHCVASPPGRAEMVSPEEYRPASGDDFSTDTRESSQEYRLASGPGSPGFPGYRLDVPRVVDAEKVLEALDHVRRMQRYE